jgi:hypothetical protein
VDTTTYKLLLLMHIASIVVAFSPAAAHTTLIRQFGQDGPQVLQRLAGYMSVNSQRIYGTALILAGLFGIGLIFSSDDAWKFSQGWISMAFVVWIAMNGVLHALIIPGERAVGSGDEAAQRKLDLGGGIMTLLFLVMLYLMIWKPGL